GRVQGESLPRQGGAGFGEAGVAACPADIRRVARARAASGRWGMGSPRFVPLLRAGGGGCFGRPAGRFVLPGRTDLPGSVLPGRTDRRDPAVVALDPSSRRPSSSIALPPSGRRGSTAKRK